jgi:hypothetical protein
VLAAALRIAGVLLAVLPAPVGFYAGVVRVRRVDSRRVGLGGGWIVIRKQR